MEIVFKIVLCIHIVAGSIALLAGLAAILFRNKIKWHRPFGMVYFVSMNVIFVSATFMSIYTVNIFLTYKNIPGAEKPTCEITHIYGREEAYEVINRSREDYKNKFL